ncbi:MAG: tRNA lysidine(34) synthetase TilS [Crocinitomicaceae bacterium]
MRNLIAHIDAFLKAHQAQRIIVACSSGLDSTVLLHASKELNIPLEIAHVNYQLRGAESDQDQAFLEELAASLSIPIHVKKIDLNKQLKHGGNLQDLARKERYDFFRELIQSEKHTFVLLGHHKEDQTETFFMNLARNSGIMGLAAMPLKRGNYLRPLLSFSKDELKEFANKNGIRWREDSSNQSLKYTRNEWRNLVLPELRKQLPELDDAVATLTQQFQTKQTQLQEKIDGILVQILKHHSISSATFQSLDQFEIIELCRQLGQPLGIAETWAKLTHKGTGVDLQPNAKIPFSKMIFDGDSYSFLAPSIKVERGMIKETVASLPSSFQKNEIYLDTNLIQGELRLRNVQTGDRIHPIGMNGSRLVSDVISDAKLTHLKKQQLQILIDDENVLWVPDLCVSRKAIASEKSAEILKIKLD